MPRPCLICSNSARAEKAADLIANGLSDQAVANALNGMAPDQPAMSEMAVSRHRRAHILKPTQDRLALLGKDREARQKRQELATAAASDTPSTEALIEATLGLRAQTEKLGAIEQRLTRMADVAEAAGSASGVAQLSAQSLRSIEVGSKLAGVGGYSHDRAADQNAQQEKFSVTIVLGGQTTRITTDAINGPTVIDGPAPDEGPVSEDDDEVDQR